MSSRSSSRSSSPDEALEARIAELRNRPDKHEIPVVDEQNTTSEQIQNNSQDEELSENENSDVGSKTNSEKTESVELKESEAWQPVWDDNSKCYYYWNSVTNETTWEIPPRLKAGASTNDYYSYTGYNYPGYSVEAYSNPLDSLLDKADQIKERLDGKKRKEVPVEEQGDEREQEFYYNKPYTHSTASAPIVDSYAAQPDDYKVAGSFNTHTGRFQADLSQNPEKYGQENIAIRQCNYYFDYDSFAQERGSRLQFGGSNKHTVRLTKKELAAVKERKKKKKEAAKRKWLLQD
ncbi:hypothetical protein K7432_005916 [Basidiobolus ranarum]|uniref:WW domain-containing protein n=1 Tax=Basidiobolus ranarum TaxID=34480 RepID=A0ABR2W2J9_9FUNG